MERGECDGWLRMFLSKNDSQVKIAIKHKHTHSPYEDISLPEKWKTFIKDNPNMTPAEVCYKNFLFNLLLMSESIDMGSYSQQRRWKRY
jgi:hypothetical protein